MDNQESEVMFIEKIPYLVSIWWLRIIISFGALLFISVYFDAELINGKSLVLCYVTIFIILFLIELCRRNGNLDTFGLSFRRLSLKEIMTGIVLFTVGAALIIIAAMLFGAEVNWIYFFPKVITPYDIIVDFLKIGIFEIFIVGVIFRGIEQRVSGVIALIVTTTFIFLILMMTTQITTPYRTSLVEVNYALAIFVSCFMYLITRSLWLPIIFNLLCFWFQGSAFNNMLPEAQFLVFPVEDYKFRWLFIGREGIVGGLSTTFIFILILAILPKITKVSPYAAAALFKQQYAESEARGII